VDLESEVLKSMRERLLKDFMDVLIMARLRNNDMSGYDVIAYIHNKFNILISSGTVYSLLYSMERDGLIKGKRNNRKRTYTLTGKGKETIKVIQNANGATQNFIAMLLQAK
jgi:DNA-binding PadR family transcriptional regulator